jgi:hypothetical protein
VFENERTVVYSPLRLMTVMSPGIRRILSMATGCRISRQSVSTRAAEYWTFLMSRELN